MKALFSSLLLGIALFTSTHSFALTDQEKADIARQDNLRQERLRQQRLDDQRRQDDIDEQKAEDEERYERFKEAQREVNVRKRA